MRIAVGSGNPVKRRAVERALDRGKDPQEARDEDRDGDGERHQEGVLDRPTVEAVPVPSGVSEQPDGLKETIAGAKNRASAVLDRGDYDLGVGIEGGVARIDGADGLFLVMWAAVSDGTRCELGAGPSVRLPDTIASRMDDGAELGPVMDDTLDTTGVAERDGAIAAFTNGRVDRTDALAAAVAVALGPFVSDLY